MTIHDVAAYLARFDAPLRIVQSWDESATDSAPDVPPTPQLEKPVPVVDTNALRAELEAHYVAARELDRAAFEERLRRARDDWTTAAAETLCRRMTEALERIASELRADVAKILRARLEIHG